MKKGLAKLFGEKSAAEVFHETFPSHVVAFDHSLRNGWRATHVWYQERGTTAIVGFAGADDAKTTAGFNLDTMSFTQGSHAFYNAPMGAVDFLCAMVKTKVDCDILNRLSRQRAELSVKQSRGI